MSSQMAFTIEELRAAADLVSEFGSQDNAVASQLILDLAIAKKFDDTGNDAAFRENMGTVIRLRLAQNEARVFRGASKAVH